MNHAVVEAHYDWLVMLFLGGGNDLFRFGENMLDETQRVGSTDRVAVVAEHDPTEPGEPTVRGQILDGRWEKQSIGLTAGDPPTILDFIEYSKRRFPAEKKMLVLWDHGNGWQVTHVFGSIVEETAAQRIEAIFNDGQSGISLLCFDSCLMAMIEIVYQLRGKVECIVASEHVVPADTGWPYATILSTLAMRPHTTPSQVACAIVDGFSGSYNNFDQAVTLSALKVDKVEDAVKAVSRLACVLIAACVNGQDEKVMFARRYAQSFGNPDYIDIISFCDELQRQPLSPEIKAAAEYVKEKVAAMILAATRGSARSVSAAHGLSIYFPERPMSSLYAKLDFAKPENCMWATFIAMMAPKLDLPKPLRVRRHRVKVESEVDEAIVTKTEAIGVALRPSLVGPASAGAQHGSHGESHRGNGSRVQNGASKKKKAS